MHQRQGIPRNTDILIVSRLCFWGKWKLNTDFSGTGERKRKSLYRITLSDVKITPDFSHQRGNGELAPIV